MPTEETNPGNKKMLKIIIPVIILAAAIYIFKSGYKVGHWLYAWIHN